MSQLAILGGTAAIGHPFKKYETIGAEEAAAVQRVMDSKVLSDFLGTWSAQFRGGAKVNEFERSWESKFGAKHAVSMNSATSCLYASIGAIGVGPGDEVIVSPYTMSATASAILVYNAVPVFADIEPETFNLSPDSVRDRISPHTKAILVTNLFGHPARLDELAAIAAKHNLFLIEDNAQSILASHQGEQCGTIGDIGVFSLNYHKHIHTGEGGLCVTDDPELAERLQLIRNHAEAVVGRKGTSNLVNMLGFNFRLGELEAAIGIEQLKKVDALVESRRTVGEAFRELLGDIPSLRMPIVRTGCSHSYYIFPMLYDRPAGAPHRDDVVAALKAEGVPVSAGYVKPLYLEPLYQNRIVFGDQGCPFTCEKYRGTVSYSKGICPVVERIQEEQMIALPACAHEFDHSEREAVAAAFHKVFAQLTLIPRSV